MIEQFELKLVDSWMLAPTVRHVVLERSDGHALPFKAGQFIQVHFHYDDGKPTRRSFSVATIPEPGADAIRQIELAVSYVEGGAATKLFQELEHGEAIQASGSFGRFTLRDEETNRRYILIATGTGVTTYRAMLPDMERLMATRGCRFVLLQGARNEGELLYAEDFDAFAERHPELFTYRACLSRAPRAEPRPGDHAGHVQDLLPELAPDPEGDLVYLCGNPDMIDDTFAVLKEQGLSVRQIRREKYVSSR